MAGNEKRLKVATVGEYRNCANQANRCGKNDANNDGRERHVRHLTDAAVGGGFLVLMEVNDARGSGDDDEGEHKARD